MESWPTEKIGLKWEPHGARVVSSEASLSCNPTFGIDMYPKGVALPLSDLEAEWVHWVD